MTDQTTIIINDNQNSAPPLPRLHMFPLYYFFYNPLMCDFDGDDEIVVEKIKRQYDRLINHVIK